MLLAAAIGLLLSGCLPAPVTTSGQDVARLYDIFLTIGSIVAIIVLGLTTWCVIRYRRRRRDEPPPPQTHANVPLEIFWTAVPLVTVGALFVLTLVALERVDSTSARPAAQVDVTGFRWGWTFSYTGENVSVTGIGTPGPELVVPVGEPVLLRMTAPDVAHSFYVPQFLFKRDLIPGRVNVYEFTVTQPGSYGGQCAEYCGLYHARMPFTVTAVSRPEYDAWLNAHRGPASPAVGSPVVSQPAPSGTPSEPAASAPPAGSASTSPGAS